MAGIFVPELAASPERTGGFVDPGWPESLPAMVGSVGLDDCRRPDYDWPGRKRGDIPWGLFQYTLDGEGLLEHHGDHHRCLPGTALLLTIPGDHRYRLPTGGRWRFFYLSMSGPEVVRLWPRIEAQAGPLLDLAPGAPALTTAAELCRDVLSATPPNRYALAHRSFGLICELLEVCQAAGVVAPAPGLEAARAWAQANLHRSLGVDDLARRAGLSRWHFTRCFTAAYGRPPAAWLSEARIQLAAGLLARGRTASDAARRAGFTDASYFSKVFRRHTGMRPRDWRG